jgi:hypothetical protein
VLDHRFEVAARVPFLEMRQHPIVDRLHRGGHEQAAGVLQHRQQIGVRSEVLDLDGDVVGETGELARQRGHQLARVTRAVEEIWIAERDVPRPVGDLPPDILQHHGDRDDAEAAVVDGNDGTVPAAVFAAAARLGVARHAPLAANLHGRVS